MLQKKIFLITVGLLLTLLLAACGGDTGATQPEPAAAPAGDVAQGQQLYLQSCSACHGADGAGVPGLGKAMTESVFTQSLSDAELLQFIKEGRPASHPDSTTGIDMPPKGGNPALTDGQLMDIIAYMRSIER
jgi:mono/diheme cytochrome c family protein